MSAPGGKRHVGRPPGAKRKIGGAPTRVSLRHKRVEGEYSSAFETEWERHGAASRKRQRRSREVTVTRSDQASFPPAVDRPGNAIGRYNADVKDFELGVYSTISCVLYQHGALDEKIAPTSPASTSSITGNERPHKKAKLSPDERKTAVSELRGALSLSEKKTLAVLRYEEEFQRSLSKMKAYDAAAALVGVHRDTIRGWIADFDENGELSESRRGKQPGVAWILNDPYTGELFDQHVRENSRRKGKANLTAEDQAKWVTETLVPGLRKRIVEGDCDTFESVDEVPKLTYSTSTVRRWMKRRGFRFSHTKKGMYVDGHEREDVVKYRQDDYLPSLKECAARGPIISETKIEWPEGVEPGGMRRPLLKVPHDESYYNANDEQPQQWVADGESVCEISYLYGNARNIRVSDFLFILYKSSS